MRTEGCYCSKSQVLRRFLKVRRSCVRRRFTGREFQVLAARWEKDLPPSVVQWMRGGGEGKVGGAEMACLDVEVEMLVEVGRAGVVESLVIVDQEFEDDPFVDGEPVKVSEVGLDVFMAREIKDESC
ncbi:hypothetical protein NDU88_007054 [Pleurodeles waltl]|uniref:Uncharacterized protein n=1 Tax=Pleurodeles waltl TaxID=8319 RepID=A0AAV7PN66_PLEWA|nr:hypothetical protein NDU88_007054 [Pleurodeles waltl]